MEKKKQCIKYDKKLKTMTTHVFDVGAPVEPHTTHRFNLSDNSAITISVTENSDGTLTIEFED